MIRGGSVFWIQLNKDDVDSLREKIDRVAADRKFKDLPNFVAEVGMACLCLGDDFKLLDIEKFHKNLSQLLINLASGNLNPNQLLKLGREQRFRFESTRQSVLEYFKSWDLINHLLGNLEAYQIDSLAAVQSALDVFKRHDKVLAFTNKLMVFIQRMNPTTIVDFSSLCFFVLAVVQNVTAKYRAEQKTETFEWYPIKTR